MRLAKTGVRGVGYIRLDIVSDAPDPLVTIREPAEHLLQEGACSKQ